MERAGGLRKTLQIARYLKVTDLRKWVLAKGGERLLDGRTRKAGRWKDRRDSMATGKTKCASCKDCYFGANGLCALELGKPCPTFRHVDRGLRPERQLAFVFRTERTHAAYAFPQPR
jgi:hypothetical protein